MDFVKRHWWLVATIAAMVVLSAGALVLRHMSISTADARERTLQLSLRTASNIQPVPPALLEPLDKANTEMQENLEKIRNYPDPKWWQPLVPGDNPEWFQFRDAYRSALRQLERDLNAVSRENLAAASADSGSIVVAPEAFYTAPALKAASAPSPSERTSQMLSAQEDMWLMQDLVKAIVATNDLHYSNTGLKPSITNAAIKELLKIEIGAQYAQPSTSRTTVAAGERYLRLRPPAGSSPFDSGLGTTSDDQGLPREVRALTVTGHASNNNEGKYRVLPFRITVLADAAQYAELIRQLPKDSRSFVTVLNVSFSIIPDADTAYRGKGLSVSTADQRLAIYGKRPLARVEIVGQSLVFTDPAVRPTPGKTPNGSGGQAGPMAAGY